MRVTCSGSAVRWKEMCSSTEHTSHRKAHINVCLHQGVTTVGSRGVCALLGKEVQV